MPPFIMPEPDKPSFWVDALIRESVGSRLAARSGRSVSRSAASSRPVACVSQAAVLPFAARYRDARLTPSSTARSPASSIIRPERAAIAGETGLLRALEGAFEVARIAIPRADLRAAIQGGAAKLRLLPQTLADKATPIALDTGGAAL
jgi:hypothetical protein